MKFQEETKDKLIIEHSDLNRNPIEVSLPMDASPIKVPDSAIPKLAESGNSSLKQLENKLRKEEPPLT